MKQTKNKEEAYVEILKRKLKKDSNIVKLLTTKKWWTDINLVIEAFKELKSLQTQSLLKNMNVSEEVIIKNDPHKGVYVNGTVIASRKIKLNPPIALEGPLIIGPESEIGPFSYIKGPTILVGNNRIGLFVEVRRSILFPSVKLSHLAYIGHSILGREVNIGALSVTAVRNLKTKEIKIKYMGSKINTKESHFGCIISDGVQTSVGTYIMPGIIIASKKPIFSFDKEKGILHVIKDNILLYD